MGTIVVGIDGSESAKMAVGEAANMAKDLGDKVAPDERAKVESALSDLRSVLKSDDKAAIDKKAEALMQASGNIAQQAAAAAGAQGGGAAGPQGAAGAGTSGAGGSKPNDDAVDAEFEEVKDKKKAS